MAQDTIKNFFAAPWLVFTDRPFAIGDRVVVDGHDGVVQEVGFRSTRIRTLEGNLVTLPNGELANKTILNIGQRPHIHRLMNVTIPYDTPPKKVRRAVEILRDVLANHEGMEKDFPPRVFFNDFNSASLNLLVIYWYHLPDYWAYMAFSEKVNMEILRRFNDEGIEFAFPTQTLYLAGDPAAFAGPGRGEARMAGLRTGRAAVACPSGWGLSRPVRGPTASRWRAQSGRTCWRAMNTSPSGTRGVWIAPLTKASASPRRSSAIRRTSGSTSASGAGQREAAR